MAASMDLCNQNCWMSCLLFAGSVELKNLVRYARSVSHASRFPVIKVLEKLLILENEVLDSDLRWGEKMGSGSLAEESESENAELVSCRRSRFMLRVASEIFFCRASGRQNLYDFLNTSTASNMRI